jgi:hypothetical protein
LRAFCPFFLSFIVCLTSSLMVKNLCSDGGEILSNEMCCMKYVTLVHIFKLRTMGRWFCSFFAWKTLLRSFRKRLRRPLLHSITQNSQQILSNKEYVKHCSDGSPNLLGQKIYFLGRNKN